MSKADQKHKAAIRWRCRRGMLELDKILYSFFDACYHNLDKREQVTFEKLLNCTDEQLWSWLILKEGLPADEALMRLTNQIQSHSFC